MTDVTVEIRSARHRQPVLGCQLAIASLCLAVVVAVSDLECLETSGNKPRNQVIHGGQARVSQRDNPSCLANDGKHCFRRRATSRHERRLAGSQQPLERIVAITGVTGADECIRYLWSADTAASAGRHRRNQRFRIDGVTKSRESIADLSNAFSALTTLRLQKITQGGARRIDKVGEHVDVSAIFDSGDLHSRDQPNTMTLCSIFCFHQRTTGVVIGDADRAQTAGGGAGDEDRRLQEPVRGSGMKVKIDQESATDCRRGRRLVTRRTRRRR